MRSLLAAVVLDGTWGGGMGVVTGIARPSFSTAVAMIVVGVSEVQGVSRSLVLCIRGRDI